MSVLSDPRIGQALSNLPDYLGSHVRVSLAALLLGLVVSLPLAVLARNRPFLRGTLLAVASIVITYLVQRSGATNAFFDTFVAVASCVVIGYLASWVFPDRRPDRDLTGLTLFGQRTRV